MENHSSHIFKTLQGRAATRLAAAIIISLMLLSSATGCAASQTPPAETGTETDHTLTPGEVIPAEDPTEQERHFAEEDLRLIDAIDQGDTETLRRLLHNGADPNESDAYGSPSPLSVAVLLGNLEMVQLLLAAGADPNKADRDGTSPALMAAQLGHPEILN